MSQTDDDRQTDRQTQHCSISATVIIRSDKNGDNSFAAADILAICCKSVITFFIFAVFDVTFSHYATNWRDIRFCIYYSITTNTSIKN